MLGPALATYTAVLLANTAVPAWHEAHRELPFVFAGSAAAAAWRAGLVGAPVGKRPAVRLAVARRGVELAAAAVHGAQARPLGEHYRRAGQAR